MRIVENAQRIGCGLEVVNEREFEELETLALGPQAIGVGAVEGFGHRRIKVGPGNRSTGFQAGGDEGGCTDFGRSEEHTYELKSLMRLSYAVFCFKKKHIRNCRTNKNTI